MPSYPKNYPFYNWVPKPVGIIIMLLLFIPILTVGGVYSVNSTEMMSGLGIISEHIQFTNFVTSIGMAAFAPFLYRLMRIRREKMMCLAGFSLMYVFSYICAETDSIFILALCSLLMGFLRMVLMMVNLFTLIKYAAGMEATRNITPGLEPDDDKGWNKLDIDRCVSQPGIYLFFMILGQLGTSLTAWLAFEYEWQYVYYFMMGTVLLSILVIFITMPYHKFATRRFPINFRQFGNVAVFCITLVCITYVLVYGKVLDWYDDPSICWATAISILFAGIFLYMDVTRRSSYFILFSSSAARVFASNVAGCSARRIQLQVSGIMILSRFRLVATGIVNVSLSASIISTYPSCCSLSPIRMDGSLTNCETVME